MRHDQKWWLQHFGSLLAPPPSGRAHARRTGSGDPFADYEYRRRERLQAIVLVARVLIARHDGRTMRVCRDAPDDNDEVTGIPLEQLARLTGLVAEPGSRRSWSPRLERALVDLKSCGFEMWRQVAGRRVPRQPREWIEDHLDERGRVVPGHWRAWPAVRLLAPHLFKALGLEVSHSMWRRKKADEWAQARARRNATTQHSRRRRGRRVSSPEPVGSILAFATVMQRPGGAANAALAPPRPRLAPPAPDTESAERARRHTLAELRTRLYSNLATQHPDWSAEQLREATMRLLQ